MIFLTESIVLCILFTLLIRAATWCRQTAFTNDYPPVVTDKLRAQGLIAQRPPARSGDVIRKGVGMLVFAVAFALMLRYINGIEAFFPAALTAYGLWAVVDWYDFAVVDILLARFDRFYRAAGVSGFEPSAVRFHFLHSAIGMLLGIPFALLAGALTALL